MCPTGDIKDMVWDNSFERNKVIEPGSILIAEPFMADDNFKKAVVLICEHSKMDGTLGFVLNHSTKFLVEDLIDEASNCKMKVFYGGPCEQDTLHYIHTLGMQIPESIDLGNGLYWGGEFDVLLDLMNSEIATEANIRFYLGFAGWSYEQLMVEINENSWVIGQSSIKMLFEYSSNDLWQQVLEEMGTTYKILSKYPENPSLN